jgi:hypothetical protein
MSSISLARKVRPIDILNKRNFNLFIFAALVTTLVAIAAASLASPARQSFDQAAYMLHRQGEWLSEPVSNAEAYQIFRRGEVASPVSNAEAYRLFRLGEWQSVGIPVTAVDLSAYHTSERTLVGSNAGLEVYLLSERTMVDPQAGMAAYLNSERTHVPAPFNKYQLSEWFGE